MAITDQTARGLAEILAARAAEFPTLVESPHPDAIQRRLVDFNVDEKTADAIAWGTLHELDAIDLKRLALAFSLDERVLALYLHPSSDDVAEQTLTDVLKLMDEDCGRCDALHDRLQFYFANPDLDEREPLAAILHDLLAHLVQTLGPEEEYEPVSQYELDPHPWDEDRDHDKDNDGWDDVAPLIGRLLHAFSQIPSRTLQEEIVRSVESAIEPVDSVDAPATEHDNNAST